MNKKITDLTEIINSVDNSFLYIVDTTDLSEDVAGTSKKIKKGNLLKDKADLVGGKVPVAQLPSYVDDVVEVADYASLPITGETGKIYVTLDNNKIYRWTGSVYIEISQGITDHTQLSNIGTNTHAQIDSHIADINNPHNVTKTQIGLGNVDNTSDANKPISTATQTALNAKENTITAGTTAQYYRGDKTFQTLDKVAVGLSNVDNTSDLNKPISTLTQTALNLKANQDGTILYHTVKWFTPLGNVSNVGATVTSVNAQFTSAMVGAKLIINGEQRIITAFTSTTVVTVNSAYSVNNTNITPANWGVYSMAYTLISGNDSNVFFNTGGTKILYIDANGNYVTASLYGAFNRVSANRFAININGGVFMPNNGTFIFSSTTNAEAGTADLGFRRNSAGVLEIYDGITATGLLANRRDLLIRNLVASAIQLTALPDSTGDALYTKYLTAKTDGTVGWENKPSGTQIFTYSVESGIIKKTLTIPSGVTTILSSQFQNEIIDYLTISNTVTTIQNSAFSNNKLTSLTIPNSVTSIGNFSFITNLLTAVTLPAGCTYRSNSFDAGVTITGGILI